MTPSEFGALDWLVELDFIVECSWLQVFSWKNVRSFHLSFFKLMTKVMNRYSFFMLNSLLIFFTNSLLYDSSSR